MSFGVRLKALRKSRGLTQKELAIKINAKHTAISNWENGQNYPDVDTIELICGALDISPNQLLLDAKKSPISAEAETGESERVFELFFKFLIEAGYIREGDNLSAMQAKGAAAAIKVVEIFFDPAQGHSVSDA